MPGTYITINDQLPDGVTAHKFPFKTPLIFGISNITSLDQNRLRTNNFDKDNA